MNGYYRMTSAEEDFDNEVVKMTHCVHTGQPPSPASPIIAQWAHEQSGLVAVEEDMHRFSNMYFYSPRLIRLWSPRVPNLPAAEPNTEPWIRHVSHSDKPSTWWQVDYIRLLST